MSGSPTKFEIGQHVVIAPGCPVSHPIHRRAVLAVTGVFDGQRCESGVLVTAESLVVGRIRVCESWLEVLP